MPKNYSNYLDAGCILMKLVDRSLILRNLSIYTPYIAINKGCIIIEDGYISKVDIEPCPTEDVDTINLDGYIAGPGFIDTHIHGLLGFDVMDAKPSSFLSISRILPRYGVTGFIPTTVTAPHNTITEVCKAFIEAYSQWSPSIGARFLGLHLEGPYINSSRAGAQNKQFIRKPNIDEFKEYYNACKGLIREVTIAPEVEGAIKFIEIISKMGIVVQIGHTDATYSEAIKGILAGASKATHLYNGMRGIHHREPGAAIALLSTPNVYIETIADLIHVSREMLKFTIDYSRVDRIVLITDAISATGMPDGIYELGGLKVKVEGGIPKLIDSGSLAGSTLTMDRAFRNIVSLGYSIGEAFAMASTNPAKSINAIEKERIGLIKPGYRADLVILNRDLEVVMTIVNGDIVFSKINF